MITLISFRIIVKYQIILTPIFKQNNNTLLLLGHISNTNKNSTKGLRGQNHELVRLIFAMQIGTRLKASEIIMIIYPMHSEQNQFKKVANFRPFFQPSVPSSRLAYKSRILKLKLHLKCMK